MFLFKSDTLLKWILWSCTLAVSLLVFLIIFFLVIESLPALAHISIASFFTNDTWHPLEGQYNLSTMIWGTLWATLGAIIIAAPLGIFCAIFIQYYAPNSLAKIIRSIIELLAGIPSVVYGFWALTVLVPIINQLEPPGASLLAGIIVLSLMILPTITLISNESFARINKHYPLNAHALGLSRWTTIRHILLPSARNGISTGIVLATCRALGETMAVLMVCGNIAQNPSSIFDPIRTLTANIALEMAYATEHHRATLFVSGLVLMLVIIILQFASNRLSGKQHHAQ